LTLLTSVGKQRKQNPHQSTNQLASVCDSLAQVWHQQLVSVGRGIGGKENFELAEELAGKLGA